MTISIARCPNSEFLLKLHDGERTVMTLVLTEADARSLDSQLHPHFEWPPGNTDLGYDAWTPLLIGGVIRQPAEPKGKE